MTLLTKFVLSASTGLTTQGFLNNIKEIVAAKIGAKTVDNSVSLAIKTYLKAINYYGGGGLMISIHYVFITNAIVTALNTVIDFSFFKKLFLRRKALKEGSNCKLTQKQANEYIVSIMPII